MDLIGNFVSRYRDDLIDRFHEEFEQDNAAFETEWQSLVCRVIPDSDAFQVDRAEMKAAIEMGYEGIDAVPECMHKLVSFKIAARGLIDTFCILERNFVSAINKAMDSPTPSINVELACEKSYRSRIALCKTLGSYLEFMTYFINIERAVFIRSISDFYASTHLWDDESLRFRLSEDMLYREIASILKLYTNIA